MARKVAKSRAKAKPKRSNDFKTRINKRIVGVFIDAGAYGYITIYRKRVKKVGWYSPHDLSYTRAATTSRVKFTFKRWAKFVALATGVSSWDWEREPDEIQLHFERTIE